MVGKRMTFWSLVVPSCYNNRQLAVQAKRSFNGERQSTLTARRPLQAFGWTSTQETGFNPARDALLLVTLRGTQTLLNGLGGLLDCARNLVQ